MRTKDAPLAGIAGTTPPNPDFTTMRQYHNYDEAKEHLKAGIEDSSLSIHHQGW